MKKTSIQTLYYFMMICNIVLLICSIGCETLILIYLNKFIELFGKIWGLIFVIFISLAFVYLIITALKNIIIFLKDYKALKQKQFSYISGKVIGFKRNREPESGVQINDNPIIRDLENNTEITLIINDKIIVGEVYKFAYLKNSRIAEIIK